MDYGKFKYEQAKREKESRKGSKHSELREVRMRVKIDEHDIDFKSRTARKLLAEGDKVKVSVMFRAREITHPEIGRELLDRFYEKIRDVSTTQNSNNLRWLAQSEGKFKFRELKVPQNAWPTNAMMITEDEAKNKRPMITGMLRAFAKGHVFVVENPRAALQVAKKLYPELVRDDDVQRQLTFVQWSLAESYDMPQYKTPADRSVRPEGMGRHRALLQGRRPDRAERQGGRRDRPVVHRRSQQFRQGAHPQDGARVQVVVLPPRKRGPREGARRWTLDARFRGQNKLGNEQQRERDMARKTKKPTRKAAPKKKTPAKRAAAPARSGGATRKVIVPKDLPKSRRAAVARGAGREHLLRVGFDAVRQRRLDRQGRLRRPRCIR